MTASTTGCNGAIPLIVRLNGPFSGPQSHAIQHAAMRHLAMSRHELLRCVIAVLRRVGNGMTCRFRAVSDRMHSVANGVPGLPACRLGVSFELMSAAREARVRQRADHGKHGHDD